MEKKFFAVANNKNLSKMCTYDEAIAWATQMAPHGPVLVCEVKQVVKQTTPPVVVENFVPEVLPVATKQAA